MPKVNNTLFIIMRYPLWAVPFAFLSMALFRLPLMLSKKIRFWRLMGGGINGTFDTMPDLRQWAMLLVLNEDAATPITVGTIKKYCGGFIARYLGLFKVKTHGYWLQPIEGHGLWNGKKVFGELPKKTAYEGRIAVLTRATIRLSKLRAFWSNVPAVASYMATAPGFEKSYGIGEIPWVKQATFSIWQSREQMTAFAYKHHEHRAVIKKTYANDWYSEEMFTRFIVMAEI